MKKKEPVIIQFTKRQENGAERFPDETFSDQENDGDLVTEMADTESSVDWIIPDEQRQEISSDTEFPRGTENNDIGIQKDMQMLIIVTDLGTRNRTRISEVRS